ncbi:uncharacterized protein LOC131475691 [Solea solea]|uniref:uncharacterized protein LOC131475691 n=1 Tax=Solea solea TaxID=90069 RepID=UPI00272C8138|nr:uncharacterized protein LOC131475691 [Solea solea]
MSAVGLQLTIILCVSCTVLSDPGGSGVVWKKAGEAITIQCTTSEEEEFMTLNKGLLEEVQVIHTEFKPEGNVITAAFSGRLQVKTKVCNVDILIKNLTTEDTGPYWCVYKKFNSKDGKVIATKGKGSVLLVVTANGNQVDPVCERNDDKLIQVFIVIAAAVLISLIIGALIWMFFKIKTLRTTVKPRRVTTSDVYEDMRGTLRR